MFRLFVLVLVASQSFGADFRRIEPSADVVERLVALNRARRVLPSAPRAGVRPYADYERAGFVIFADAYWHDRLPKETLLREMPDDVTAVVLVENEKHAAEVQRKWGRLRPEGKLRFLKHEEATSNGALWSRDSIPVPLIADSALSLVASLNWFGFEPWKEVSEYFAAPMTTSGYYFEGGNFKADAEGNCFVVEARLTESIPSDVFRDHFGCKKLARLPRLGGIGHADERIMLFANKIAFTDEPRYVTALENAGYKVRVLPQAGGFRTYMNVLALDNVLFVPTFQTDDDAVVLDAYRGTGYRVVPIDSRDISDDGHGSIHCLTMAYPPGSRFRFLATN